MELKIKLYRCKDVRAIAPVALVLIRSSVLCAQHIERPSFEAVSVKLTGLHQGVFGGESGGPGTRDPARWRSLNTTLAAMILKAYDLKRYQYLGPAWSEEVHYDVEAVLPHETNNQTFLSMLQTMISERFRLVFHREQREITIWKLCIAKGGPKLKMADGGSADTNSGKSPGKEVGGIRLDRDKYPILLPSQTVAMTNGRARCQLRRTTLEGFTIFLTGQLDRPVIDATNLSGEYRIALAWVDEARLPDNEREEAYGDNLFMALKKQLGLSLEPSKAPMNVFVVDSAQKLPVPN